jgi:8-oxo-dGTP diphosphatase
MPASNQGVLTGRYKLIPRTLVFLTQGDNILLLKGAKDKRLWANKYNGIGGHLERGEDIYSGAKRELYEETGLYAQSLWLCAVIAIDTGEDTGIGIFVFRGDFSHGVMKSSTEGSLDWIPLAKLQNFPLVEDLFVLLPRILDLKPSDPPIGAHYSYNDADELLITFTNN